MRPNYVTEHFEWQIDKYRLASGKWYIYETDSDVVRTQHFCCDSRHLFALELFCTDRVRTDHEQYVHIKSTRKIIPML